MKTFYWLVKREFWEHRGSFLWAPVVTAGVVLIINILTVIAGEVIGSRHFDTNMMWQKLATANPDDIRKVGALLDVSALLPCFIVSLVLFFVLYSYCMKSLSSDRSDRSILFWKSLPVSDLSTVLSKVFSAVIVAPVIAVIVSILGAIGMLLIFGVNGALHGVGFGEVVWGLAHPGRIITSMAGLLPIYMIWMLPCVGWLMLCSAWSKGKVARWAIALPIG
ncbi:MAG TPA: ABC-2 transporter permease, partial [Rhodanobacteraceae bacterium]|nr:ABC-2 transporter permease [Rhodanobacteraceae bacterium]